MNLSMKVKLARSTAFEMDIDLELPLSGFTAVYGDSGAGKTTLLRCLAGLETPTAGSTITLNDVAWVSDHCHVPPEQRGIGYVFQDARLFPHLSVRGNLEYSKLYTSKWASDSQLPSLKQVVQWLALTPLLDRPTTELSGGQAQRVAIARALLCSHKLLLMDEPVSALDPAARQDTLECLEQVHRESRIPVIYVSHNIEEVTRLADQLVVLHDGTVTAHGPTLDMCSRINLALAHEEEAAAILRGTVMRIDDSFRLTEVDTGSGTLFLAHSNYKIGDVLQVRIPARDVSITLEGPQNTSILNVLPARIIELEDGRDSRVLLQLAHGDQKFLARVTRKSVDALKLRTGLEVYAQIKSVALLSQMHGISPQHTGDTSS